MRRAGQASAESSRIMLGLLDAVEQERAHRYRPTLLELGIALGLVNAYLKRCIKKGLVKGAGTALCVLPDAARLRREVPADRGISRPLVRVLPPSQDRLLLVLFG